MREDNTKRVKKKRTKALIDNITRGTLNVTVPVVYVPAQSHLTLGNPMDRSLQAPLSTGFPRQEYWSTLRFPSSGDLHNPGTEPVSPELADRFFTTEPAGFQSYDYTDTFCHLPLPLYV